MSISSFKWIQITNNTEKLLKGFVPGDFQKWCRNNRLKRSTAIKVAVRIPVSFCVKTNTPGRSRMVKNTEKILVGNSGQQKANRSFTRYR